MFTWALRSLAWFLAQLQGQELASDSRGILRAIRDNWQGKEFGVKYWAGFTGKGRREDKGTEREKGIEKVVAIGHHVPRENRTASSPSSRCITRTIFPCHRVEHDDYCLTIAIPCAVLMFHASIVASCWKSAALCGTGLSISLIVTSCLLFWLVLAVPRG